MLIDARGIFDEEDAKGGDFIINEHVAFRKVINLYNPSNVGSGDAGGKVFI